MKVKSTTSSSLGTHIESIGKEVNKYNKYRFKRFKE
jgi:hypothetical protein